MGRSQTHRLAARGAEHRAASTHSLLRRGLGSCDNGYGADCFMLGADGVRIRRVTVIEVPEPTQRAEATANWQVHDDPLTRPAAAADASLSDSRHATEMTSECRVMSDDRRRQRWYLVQLNLLVLRTRPRGRQEGIE